ncbi:MAG: nucleotidyltransferase family protein [Acutalibacteraceae bacterium]|nr:nucleotidyltransferase family protein [Acutalibacteraceae bacterium]
MSEMKQLVEKSLISLVAFEICGADFDKTAFDVNNTEFYTLLYRLSVMHDLAHIVYCALEKTDLLPSDDKLSAKFKKAKIAAVYKSEVINNVLENIHNVLSENNIDYILLKGSVVRDYYPEKWQRTSSDIDIFVNEYDLKKLKTLFCKTLGYKDDKRSSSYDMHFTADNFLPLEVHYSLDISADDVKNGRKTENIFLNAEKQNGSLYKMNDDAFYCFQVAHLAKHFKAGGAGVRPLIDLWILDKLDCDKDKRLFLIEKQGLKEFYTEIEKVIDFWFNNQAANDFTTSLSRFILASGTHGNGHYQRQIIRLSSKNTMSYYLKRVFVPYSQLAVEYKPLRKHKALYPVYSIKRIMTFGKKLGIAKNELGIVNNISEQKQEEIYNIYKKLNLL